MTLPRTQAELERANKAASRLATKKAILSALGGAIPVPGIDIFIDIALIRKVIGEINQTYGLSPQQIKKLDAETKLKVASILLKFGEKGIANLVGKRATKELVKHFLIRMGVKSASKSASKVIPVIGQICAASLSFGIMKLMCQLHIRDCQRVIKELNPDLKVAPFNDKEAFEIGPRNHSPPPLPEPAQHN